MKYLIVLEHTDAGFSAYSPDLPGCIATAPSRAEIERQMASAIGFHLEGMKADGLELPEPRSSSSYVDVPP